jgi:hypothetical protein
MRPSDLRSQATRLDNLSWIFSTEMFPDETRWVDLLALRDRRAEGDSVRLAELCRTEFVVMLGELKAWLWEQASLPSISHDVPI